MLIYDMLYSGKKKLQKYNTNPISNGNPISDGNPIILFD